MHISKIKASDRNCIVVFLQSKSHSIYYRFSSVSLYQGSSWWKDASSVRPPQMWRIIGIPIGTDATLPSTVTVVLPWYKCASCFNHFSLPWESLVNNTAAFQFLSHIIYVSFSWTTACRLKKSMHMHYDLSLSPQRCKTVHTLDAQIKLMRPVWRDPDCTIEFSIENWSRHHTTPLIEVIMAS